MENLFGRQLLNEVDGGQASKLKIHVALLQDDEPLVHLVEQVDILDDQIRHLAADAHDVGDEEADDGDEEEAAHHYLHDGEHAADRPHAAIEVVDEWEDDKLAKSDADSACDHALSCLANAEDVYDDVLLQVN